MSKSKTWIIDTADLSIGTTLSFDLTDSEGNVLHRSGMPITERLLERLAAKNIFSLSVRQADPEDEKNPDDLLRASFPSELIRAVESSISYVEECLSDSFDAIEKNEPFEIDRMEDSVLGFIRQAEQELSATLAVLTSRLSAALNPTINHETNQNWITRSSSLSMLGVTVWTILDPDQKDALEVGVAAAFHDCSLFLHPEWFDTNGLLRGDERTLLAYRKHPLESAELMRRSSGANEQICTMIRQVHEQCDGSGFPNGLSRKDIQMASRVLNISDAYISLVQSPFRAQPYVASDAIAYLCHQSTLQRFDPHVFFAFVRGLSMYPIGSAVELDDQSIAVVIKGNAVNPLEPTVRILGGSNDVVDLSDSERFIMGTSRKHNDLFGRIEKFMMDDVLWRDDLLAEASHAAKNA